MLEVTDKQAIALVRAIVAAKFCTADSTVLLGLPELDEVLSKLLSRNYTDERLSRLIKSYEGTATSPSGFAPVLKRLQMEIDSRLLAISENSIENRVRELMFPYRPSKELIQYYINQLV